MKTYEEIKQDISSVIGQTAEHSITPNMQNNPLMDLIERLVYDLNELSNRIGTGSFWGDEIN